MNASIGRMLKYVPSGIPQAPDDVPALSISSGASLTLSDLTLYVSTGTEAATIDLHGQLVSQVSAQLPSGITGTVLQDGPAELLLWPDGYGEPPSGSSPATLMIAQAPIWQVLGVFSRTLESRRRYRRSSVQQINVRAAVGMWLDWWGASMGVPRHAGEPDSLYATRIVWTVLEPNVNNVAIEQLFAALGYGATITDTSPGNFTADFTFPSNPPSGFYYSQGQLADILDTVKAAGVVALVNFLAALEDSASLSDSIAATSPGGFAVSDVSLSDECTSA